ncbi:hypothetical protein LP417_18900 [Polaromonas sp. P1-6]|nr:hypothetical protein LP417_18900 [Polaromonas sp. P1-6]
MEDKLKVEEELRLLYQVTTQDLVFFKQQQWSVTNYVLLLYAAVVGFTQLSEQTTSCERFVLCVLATVLGASGIVILWKQEKSIAARHDRLDKIRKLFTKTFCLAWRSQHNAPDSSAIAYLLGIVMGVGVLVLWWFVFAKPLIAS